MARQKEALPTQEFIEIDYIHNDVLVLKSKSLRKIIIVSGINIELKSEEEQNIIYYSYQNFLNSLDFSLQLVVHSRKLNIEGYLNFLGDREAEETEELLKNELSEYREFIRSFVAENDIMTKNFFVVVPFDPIILPSGGIKKMLPSLPFLKKKGAEEPEAAQNSEEELEKNIFQLNQRVDQVIAGLQSIGLRAVTLNKEELVELFYNLYNPEAIEKKNLPATQETG